MIPIRIKNESGKIFILLLIFCFFFFSVLKMLLVISSKDWSQKSFGHIFMYIALLRGFSILWNRQGNKTNDHQHIVKSVSNFGKILHGKKKNNHKKTIQKTNKNKRFLIELVLVDNNHLSGPHCLQILAPKNWRFNTSSMPDPMISLIFVTSPEKKIMCTLT